MTTLVLRSSSPTAHERRAVPHLRVVPPVAPPGERPASASRVAAARSGRRAAPLRITRRGRVVVRVGVVLLGLVVTAAVVLAGGRVARADRSVHAVPVEYRVVLPGESLWQIAGDVAPGADRRETVARIVELNALPSGVVAAGTRIAVPAG